MSTPAGTAASLVESGAAVSLPNARLLNYLGNVNTPTRVRKVASIAMTLMAIAAFIVAFLFLLSPLLTFIDFLRYGSPGPRFIGGPRNLREIGEAAVWVLRNSVGSLLSMCLFSMIGLLLLVLSRMVFVGNRRACVASLVIVLPGVIPAFLGAVVCGITCVVNGVPLWHVHRNLPLALVLFVGFWASCVLLLLLRDLASYLLWIAKNPAAEKAAVAFLSRHAG